MFSLVDITCGDAIILTQLKKMFPNMRAYGVDCFKDRFVTHKEAYMNGVKIYNGYIQDMFVESPKVKFDFAIMFNSYRGWESADLREWEKDLPNLADEYFKHNVNYIFLTATYDQIVRLKRDFYIKILGNGEDDSIMFVMTCKKNKLKFSFWDNIKSYFLLKKYKTHKN